MMKGLSEGMKWHRVQKGEYVAVGSGLMRYNAHKTIFGRWQLSNETDDETGEYKTFRSLKYAAEERERRVDRQADALIEELGQR